MSIPRACGVSATVAEVSVMFCAPKSGVVENILSRRGVGMIRAAGLLRDRFDSGFWRGPKQRTSFRILAAHCVRGLQKIPRDGREGMERREAPECLRGTL